MITYAEAGAVGTISMSRPPVNAMDGDFIAAFDDALDKAEQSGRITALVIRSTERCFSAGADLSMIRQLFGRPQGAEEMVAYVAELHRLFRRVETFPGVTLAAIAGAALGGGLELALSCDLRIVAAPAKIGLPEARVGMIPGAGGTQRLTRLCGPGIASRLILAGEIIDGTEAVRIGVAQWAVPAEALEEESAAIANRIAGLSRPALAAAKDCIFAQLDPATDGYARELEKPLVLMATEEARTRIDQFFTTAR